MEIKNHILQGVEFNKSPNIGGLIAPEYLILHFDASPNSTGAISWMVSPTSKVSAHLHISREGKIVQLVPFNVKAFHAGESSWKGLKGLNSTSVGIEIQNTGSQEYTEIQMNTVIEVSKLLKEHYKLKDILGHEDIAPIRKNDPSGTKVDLFDWVSVFRGACIELKSFKTTTDVNLRRGQGTNFPIIKKLAKDTEMYELNRVGDWSKIQVKDSKQSGWIYNTFIVAQ